MTSLIDVESAASPNLRSNCFKPADARLPADLFVERVAPFAHKITWFLEHGYVPHYHQMIFHTMRNERGMLRHRHLVAGRRGGKTLSAAWELLYYLLHPQFFHWDVHGIKSDRPLHAWVLTANYPLGRAAWQTFEEVLRQAGLSMGADYKRNLGDKFFEFPNGSLLEYKTADNPQTLRGAGLDILWIDEAAFIPNSEAWNVVRPALTDKSGSIFTTTTPHGKNWFYNTFFTDIALKHPSRGSVEYWSIQNPYFPKEEWEQAKVDFHPLLFKQEFMASFDSMAGIELQGDWLHYYELSDLPRQKDNPSKYDLTTFLGVDPAISLREEADRFAMILLGVHQATGDAYLLEEFASRLTFPEQIEKVMDWVVKYRPSLVGIESNAYQAALEQQLRTMPGLASIIPVMSKGKKEERILRMAPIFRTGRIKLRKTHIEFINEWIDYDSSLKNSNDDVLDATDIALGLAGTLFPEAPRVKDFDPSRPISDINELARRSLPGGDLFDTGKPYDPEMGEEF